MGDRIAPQRNERGVAIGTGNTAQEESAAEKARKVTAAWNTRYFAHLGVGTGLGGAAAIEKYKTVNPSWEKARDKWAQALMATSAKAKAAPKPGTSLGGLVKE